MLSEVIFAQDWQKLHKKQKRNYINEQIIGTVKLQLVQYLKKLVQYFKKERLREGKL